MNDLFVGLYWGQRRENRKAVAKRLAQFFEIIRAEQRFETWYKLGISKKISLKDELDLTVAAVEKRLGDSDFVPEGFTFAAWNGADSSIETAVGAYDEYLLNSLTISLPSEIPWSESLNLAKTVFKAGDIAFAPEWGVLTSDEWLDTYDLSVREPFCSVETYIGRKGLSEVAMKSFITTDLRNGTMLFFNNFDWTDKESVHDLFTHHTLRFREQGILKDF